MNAKKAKKLRKMLREVEANQRADGKDVEAVSYLEDTRKRKYLVVPKSSVNPLLAVNDGTDPTRSTTERVQIAPGMIKVTPNTVKGLYKRLKKALNGQEQPPEVSEPSAPKL